MRSSARVRTWRNTIEALREQTLAARTHRLELMEKHEDELHAQEECIRQKERHAIIERAQRMQFEETDGAKRLTSAALLSDVLISRQFCKKVSSAVIWSMELTGMNLGEKFSG